MKDESTIYLDPLTSSAALWNPRPSKSVIQPLEWYWRSSWNFHLVFNEVTKYRPWVPSSHVSRRVLCGMRVSKMRDASGILPSRFAFELVLGRLTFQDDSFIRNQRLYYTLHCLSWIDPVSQVTHITPETVDFWWTRDCPRTFHKPPLHALIFGYEFLCVIFFFFSRSYAVGDRYCAALLHTVAYVFWHLLPAVRDHEYWSRVVRVMTVCDESYDRYGNYVEACS